MPPITKPLKVVYETSDLKVRRPTEVTTAAAAAAAATLPRRHETLGKLLDSPVKDPAKKHPIVRRINEAARKRESRRNTIDVTAKDLQAAQATLQKEFSKSVTNVMEFARQIDALAFDGKGGASLPDLSTQQLYVLPMLKVRRHQSIRDDINRVMPPNENAAAVKGPEFIVNSSLPPKQLDLSEPKVSFDSF